jgi:hypothetical protein
MVAEGQRDAHHGLPKPAGIVSRPLEHGFVVQAALSSTIMIMSPVAEISFNLATVMLALKLGP